MGLPTTVLLSGTQVLAQSSSKVHPLGTRGATRDGRVFRYARNGATALKAGYLCQSAAAVTSFMTLSTGTTELKANTSVAKFIASATSPFTTKNSITDGYLFLYTSSTAKANAQYAQIKTISTNPSATKNSVITVNFQPGEFLYSASTNAGTTNAEVGVIRNPYDKVIVKPVGVKTGIVVGVPIRPITANYYFWLQTWGPCALRSNGILDVGDVVGCSTGSTAGIIDGVTSTKLTSGASALAPSAKSLRYLIDQVGVAMVTGVAGECRLIYLKIAS